MEKIYFDDVGDDKYDEKQSVTVESGLLNDFNRWLE